MHQRRNPPGAQETARLPGVRNALHAGEPVGRDHGFLRRRLRRLLSLSPVKPSSKCGGECWSIRMSETVALETVHCPLPLPHRRHVVLGHGSGGTLTRDLIQNVFLPAFRNDVLEALEDQATLSLDSNASNAPRLGFTTDSFVVQPLFFPGGDIGTLAVHGTVNDLAVGGVIPLFLSAAFILEE